MSYHADEAAWKSGLQPIKHKFITLSEFEVFACGLSGVTAIDAALATARGCAAKSGGTRILKPDVVEDAKRAKFLAEMHASGDPASATDYLGDEQTEFLIRIKGSPAGRAPSRAGAPTSRGPSRASARPQDGELGERSPLLVEEEREGLPPSGVAVEASDDTGSAGDGAALTGSPATTPQETMWAFDRPLFLRARDGKRRALWLRALELHGSRCIGGGLLLVAAGLQPPQSLLQDAAVAAGRGLDGQGVHVGGASEGDRGSPGDKLGGGTRSAVYSMDGSGSDSGSDRGGRTSGRIAGGHRKEITGVGDGDTDGEGIDVGEGMAIAMMKSAASASGTAEAAGTAEPSCRAAHDDTEPEREAETSSVAGI